MAEFTITEEAASSGDGCWCFEQYDAELEQRFDGSVDVAAAVPLGLEDLTPPRGLVLVARLDGTAVGRGAVKLAEPRVAEIKRLSVAALWFEKHLALEARS